MMTSEPSFQFVRDTSNAPVVRSWRNMTKCPKFETCSANICPLDPLWRKRVHVKGDAVCFFLREAVKPGAQPRFEQSTPEGMHEEVVAALPDICAAHPVIGYEVERSKTKGSLLDKAARLTAARKAREDRPGLA